MTSSYFYLTAAKDKSRVIFLTCAYCKHIIQTLYVHNYMYIALYLPS